MALDKMHKSERRYEVGKVYGEEEAKQRRLRAILNKLTPQNYENLLEQVFEIGIKDAVTLRDFASQIVSRAVAEPIYCEMYADLCDHLTDMLPDLSTDNERITLKRLLVNVCQGIFEGKVKVSINQTNDEKGNARIIKLGIVRLIGELYKKRILVARIVLHCALVLLKHYPNTDEVDIEALCLLVSTAGKMLDYPATRRIMDVYFGKMMELSMNLNVSLRVRFMLLDAIELRKNNWQPRKNIERPKKIWELQHFLAKGSQSLMNRFGCRSKIRFSAVQEPHFEHHLRRSTVKLRGPFDNDSISSVFQGFPAGRELILNVSCPCSLSDGEDNQLSTQEVAGLRGSSMPSPLAPPQVMHKAERRYEIGKVFGKEDFKQRKLKAILNKLTHQNFGKLLFLVRKLKIDNVVTISGLVSQIFQKAISEPTFCELYAKFCSCLVDQLPTFREANKIVTFRRLLLSRCQEEFERGYIKQAHMKQVDEEGIIARAEGDRNASDIKEHCQRLGNIHFIGAMCEVGILMDKIVIYCIEILLEQLYSPNNGNVEALCKLMASAGKKVDHPNFKECVDRCCNVMEMLSTDEKLPYRLRFMLMDVIVLRKNDWQERRNIENPKRIEELHWDIPQELQESTNSSLSAAFEPSTSSEESLPLKSQERQESTSSSSSAAFEPSTSSEESLPFKSISQAGEFVRESSCIIEISSSSSDDNDEVKDNHLSNTACFSVEVERKETMIEEEDCYILEDDPFKSLTMNLKDKPTLSDCEEDDVFVVAERGQVACRDYPHSRHACAEYPFNKTNHENCCSQCYCYVCDLPAPCELWKGELGHCHASDRESKWISQRTIRRFLGNLKDC